MSRLGNALLVLGAAAVGLAIIELVLFPLYLRAIPTNLALMNEPFGRQLGQSSKAGVIPRDYVMLTGDSYAFGQGDPLRRAPPGSRGPYASAHFIAERLGRDVLSIGISGSSTVTAALAPALFSGQARLSLRYPIPPPAAILYYFYEGNDLDDNLRWARASRKVDMSARLYPAAEIDALIDAQRRGDDEPRASLNRFVAANLPATLFLSRAANEIGRMAWRRLSGRQAAGPASTRPPGTTNRALVAGTIHDLPDRLQGPALSLSDIEWANSVAAAKSALRAMNSAYSGVPIAVVYLPSPLASYDIVSDEVSISKLPRLDARREAVVTAAKPIAERQHRMRRDICDIARELGYGFIDATRAIRAAGRQRLVHGPGDWGHFNLEGYRALGNVVADALANGLRLAPPTDCAPMPP